MKRIGHTQPLKRLFILTSLMIVMGTLAIGCSKSQTPAPQAPAAPQQNTTQTQTQTTTSQTTVQQTPTITQGAVTNGQPDLAALQRALAGWLVGHRRRPANFEEFAATAGVPIPPPPAGKKYFLTDRMRIELVDINSNP